MTKEQKIIRAKVGLLELAKQLGNVSQACKMMGYSLFTASKPIAPRAMASRAAAATSSRGTLPSTAEPARTRACPACPSGLPEDAGVP